MSNFASFKQRERLNLARENNMYNNKKIKDYD